MIIAMEGTDERRLMICNRSTVRFGSVAVAHDSSTWTAGYGQKRSFTVRWEHSIECHPWRGKPPK